MAPALGLVPVFALSLRTHARASRTFLEFPRTVLLLLHRPSSARRTLIIVVESKKPRSCVRVCVDRSQGQDLV